MDTPSSANPSAAGADRETRALQVALREVAQRGIDTTLYRTSVEVFDDTIIFNFVGKNTLANKSIQGSIWGHPGIDISIDAMSFQVKKFSYVR